MSSSNMARAGSEDSDCYTLPTNLPLASASPNAQGHDLPANGASEPLLFWVWYL